MMTYDSANIELEELRGIVSQGGDLAPYKVKIENLYWQICRKRLRQCNCKDILKDALIECITKLKVTTPKRFTIMAETKARLVKGVVIQWEYNHYTNANITDEVAREFLAAFPMRTDWFEVLPEKVEKTPEKVAEKPATSEKVAEKATTPKKKKTAKKRK